MHSSKDGRTNFNKSRLEFADDIVVVVVAKELSHILRQQRQKQLWSCSNSTKLLYGPRTKKASSLYVRTTSKLLSTYLANGWLVAKAVVLGHFLEFSDRQLQLAFYSHCQCHKKRQAILLVLEELFGGRRCLLM